MPCGAAALLSLLSEFTGLYSDASSIQATLASGKCSALVGEEPNSSVKSHAHDDQLEAAMEKHAGFFAGYAELLEGLVGQGFRW